MLGTGAGFLLSYVIGLFPKIEEYVPTKLMSTGTLLTGAQDPGMYGKALGVTIVFAIICFIISMPIINKKDIS